jgi:hypothetical protein
MIERRLHLSADLRVVADLHGRDAVGLRDFSNISDGGFSLGKATRSGVGRLKVAVVML